MIVAGFAGIALLGAILLVLPISSQSREFTSFVDALFTSTSALCVTGMAVVDTATYWSYFGQAVILVLMQLGGLGFMVSATIVFMALGRRIGLRERLLLKESLGVSHLGGLVRLARRIFFFAIISEAAGAIILFIRFVQQEPAGIAAWKAIFHSVSAFNNAGFDIMGGFRSLIGYQTDALVLLPISALIILGGISFIVIQDIATERRWSSLSVDSKIVLKTSFVLLMVGTIVIFFSEYSNPETIGNLSIGNKLLVSFFQSVTPRSAGFASIEIGKLTGYTTFFTMFLMYIGGGSGSNAGGIKVNTFGTFDGCFMEYYKRTGTGRSRWS